MSDPDDPGETIPIRRIEEGNIVLFYDTAVSDDKERGRVVSVESSIGNQLASILIFSDERVEPDVPFAQGGYQPERGYVWPDLIEEGVEA